jgi:hypothetical protein
VPMVSPSSMRSTAGIGRATPSCTGRGSAANERKAKLARLLARVVAGIAFNEHTDEDGAVVFLHACKMGLEGIVSKRLTAPYRSGPSRDWIKIKNPDSPAMRERAPGFGNPNWRGLWARFG